MIAPRFVCIFAPIVAYWFAGILVHLVHMHSPATWPASSPRPAAAVARVLVNQALRAFIQLACCDHDELAATEKLSKKPTVMGVLVRLVAAYMLLDLWQYFVHRTLHANQYLFLKYHQQYHAFDARDRSAPRSMSPPDMRAAARTTRNVHRSWDMFLVYSLDNTQSRDAPVKHESIDRPAWAAGYASSGEWLVREGAGCFLVSAALGLGVYEYALFSALAASVGVFAHAPKCKTCCGPGDCPTPSATHRCGPKGWRFNFSFGLTAWSDWVMGTYVSPVSVAQSQRRIESILAMSVSQLGRSPSLRPTHSLLFPSSPTPSASSTFSSRSAFSSQRTLVSGDEPACNTLRRPFGRLLRRSPTPSES